MKKNKTIALALSLTCIGVLMYSTQILSPNNKISATGLPRYEKLKEQNKGFEERAKENGKPDVNQVEVLKESNKNNPNKIKPVEQMKGHIEDKNLENGAYYEKKELLTYEQFINTYPDTDLDLSIDKDRMIWVTVIHYPNGFEHKKGLVKNAVLTKYYDAETGELYGYTLKSLDKDGYGIKKTK